MNEKTELIDKTCEAIRRTSELFYQQNVNDGLTMMPIVLDAIASVSNSIMQSENISEEDGKKLSNVLNEALGAMQEKDYVMLADILQYDIIELLEEYRDMFV